MFYYGTWLKVRPLILQTLDGLTTKPLNLSAKRWRCLLDIVGGRVPGKSEDTKTSIYRVEMRNLLDTLLSKYNTPSFDLNDSTPRVEQFHEHLVDCRSEPPPTQIASKILWEITELSFCHELVVLDRRLDQSSVSLPERDTLLDACWVGSRYQPEIARANEGLAAPDIQQRIPYIRALHQLTMSWAGDKPEELYSAFPGNPDAHNYISLVERVEQSLANFYTTSFLIVFGRAASIPHFISTS
ncbi:hypothetical protein EV361DRAFT_15768 [Lentinula raphanica]|nr:hypothetical protein EV361DRAFT_15768 [Lentinula raphanica]